MASKKTTAPKKAVVISPRQKRFIDEYLIDLNGTQAAIRAGYSERTANEQAARLLAQVSIRSQVDKAIEERAKVSKLSAERILLELERLALFDIRKIFNADGSLKRVVDLDDDTAAAIMSVEMVEVGEEGQLVMSKKYKASDKKGALELAMRHRGMLNDKLELSTPLVTIRDLTGRK